MEAHYPPTAFAFAVSLDGASSAVDATFQEMSGIDPKVAGEEVEQGGANAYVHQLPGVTKYGNLVLRRGYVIQSSPLAAWAMQTVGGTLRTPIQTQTVTVSLLDPDERLMVMWTFQNAWPVKWETGQFDAAGSALLTETLEFAYTTVTRRPAAR